MKTFKIRLLTAALTAALLVGCFAVCGFAVTVDSLGDDHKEYGERLYGDVNLNGEVDAVDYMLVKRAAMGTYNLLEQGFRLADINQNGKIDALDYLWIKRSFLGTAAPLGFAPPRELTARAVDALTDEELYERIDKEIAEAIDLEVIYFSFQRIVRKTYAEEVLASLGLPDDLADKSIYPEYWWWFNGPFEVCMNVPDADSLRDLLFKLYRCAEIVDLIRIGHVYAPAA